jgi:hypothetical protein
MRHEDTPVSALTTYPASRAAARVLEAYFRAKDGNRPHLLAQVFTPDARLEVNNASASVIFPAVTQGIEGIADALVRQFGRTYENVYSFYLSVPEGAPRQFKCAWLVGMTDKQSGEVRVGCGTYEWSLVYEPAPLASGLVISIRAMQVFAPPVQSEVLAWLEQLPYPWATAAAVLSSAPALNGLSPVLNSLRDDVA